MSKRWGVPTWYFFHTFIEKITEDFYNRNSKTCIDIYVKICNNLPCPICKEHATIYLKKHNIYAITTKDAMKIFLFNFHNDVNKRLKNQQCDITILEQYKRITISKSYQYFCQEFFKINYISKHFSGWIRNKLREEIDAFFHKNICHFTH